MIKPVSLVVAIAAALGTLSTTALAGSDVGSFYISGEVGYGEPRTDLAGQSKTLVKSDDGGDAVGRVAAGYLFTINNRWALGPEFAYTGFSDKTFDAKDPKVNGKIKLETYALDLLGVARFNINPDFYLVGKAGGSYVRQKVKGSGELAGSGSEHQIKPKVALGFGIPVNKDGTLALTLTSSYTFGEDEIDVTKRGHKVTANYDILAGVNFSF
jgi:hypothetical protein